MLLRDSHLPRVIFELNQPPPRRAQALPCRLEAPVSAVFTLFKGTVLGKARTGVLGFSKGHPGVGAGKEKKQEVCLAGAAGWSS